MDANPPLILDFEASALENGYPIEVALADLDAGAVHAWLIRPHATWAWDKWDPASQRIHGLSKADIDHGDDARTVAQGVLRVVGDRALSSDNPPFDGGWLAMLFEAGREDPPAVDREPVVQFVSILALRNDRSPADIDALNRARLSAADHSAAADAASWAACIELISDRATLDLARIDAVFAKWIARAQAASPWRAPSGQSGLVRAPNDPLSYDTSDFGAMVDRMIEDVRSGRTAAAVAAELAAIRRRYRGSE